MVIAGTQGGCQSLSGEKTRPAPLIPPALSAIPGSSPTLAADGLPAPPAPMAATPNSTAATLFPPPVPGILARADASAPTIQQTAATDCLPQMRAWQQQQEEQAAALNDRLSTLEKELTAARASVSSLTEQLESSRTELSALRREVTHWKGEVRRLESEMVRQQQADLQSLDELGSALARILEKQGTENREAPE